jgi:dTDP-4-amino-4,6-dideoxygalactose transaminase
MRTSRRQFLATSTVAGAGLGSGLTRLAPALAAGAAPTIVSAATAAKPALLGGTPAHQGGWQKWPVWQPEWEADMLKVCRSGKWYRPSGPYVTDFEAAYAQLIGAKRCLATASGTTALIVSLHVLDVDAGDEVIVSPFTFVASYNAILAHKALPVFADTDPATLTLDPASIASRLTDRTRAIMPVHIYGLPCDMDAINAIAKPRGLKVVEDACQAWLAEYKGRKCGTLGDLGCFSFQESKHLPSGEGGAITGDSDDLIDRCNSFHNCGRAVGKFQGNGCFTRGGNYRMTQFQGALLLAQLDQLTRQTARRRESADYLNAELAKIPGITPAQLPPNSRGVYHLYPFRYDATRFNGLSRDVFLRALNAEGVSAHAGYKEQYLEGLLDETIASRGYQRLFSAARLKAYRESFNDLKGNRATCANTVVLPQTVLLADRAGVDHIVEAVAKIQAHSAALVAARMK